MTPNIAKIKLYKKIFYNELYSVMARAPINWTNDIKEKIDQADNEKLLEYFQILDKKWSINKDENLINIACSKLCISDLEAIDSSILAIEMEKAIFDLFCR